MIKQSSVDFLTEKVYIADIYYSDHISTKSCCTPLEGKGCTYNQSKNIYTNILSIISMSMHKRKGTSQSRSK
jgi:hypothetical protein